MKPIYLLVFKKQLRKIWTLKLSPVNKKSSKKFRIFNKSIFENVKGDAHYPESQ